MEKQFLLTHGALEIPCWLTEPEGSSIRQIVLGVHGLCGSAMDDIQRAIAEEMELYYAATLRFDFPSHGSSPLDSSGFTLQNCKDSLLAAARFAKARYPEISDLCIFATGFGAYVTLLCLETLMEMPGSVKLVIQTPSVRMHESLLAMKGISQPTFQALGAIVLRAQRPLEISYPFFESLVENTAMDSYPLPFLILHGEIDDYISIEDIQHLRRINEDAKLVTIPGASHRFLEEGAWDMVLDLTRDWFEFEQVLVTDWE